METAEASGSGHSFDLQNYVVLFLDVLGQKEERVFAFSSGWFSGVARASTGSGACR
jgi:hypothetical protein